MNMEHWIGMDVSRETLDFALLDSEGAHLESAQVANNSKAVLKLLRQWGKRYGVDPRRSLFCLEPTGHYTRPMLNLVVEQQWPAWLAHPLDIQNSMGMKRGKSDKVDALRIARYARTFREKSRLFTAQNLRLDKLKHLLTRRRDLVRTRAKHKAYVDDLNSFMDLDIRRAFDRMDKQQMKVIDKLVADLDRLITEQISSDPKTQRQYELLLSIPGVGPQLAAYLLAITDGFVRFTSPRELACQAGVAPFERSSGSSVRGRTGVSHQANGKLKTLLHMASMSVIRHAGELKDYYDRKVADGKNRMSALNAVRNKLIHRACAVIKRGTPYVIKQMPTA
jgi:transposase